MVKRASIESVKDEAKVKKTKVKIEPPIEDLATRGIKYWLMKSEPDVYGIENLQRENTGDWDGVRNYHARNFIRKMRDGDKCFLYHSSCKKPGIYGMMKIVGESFPDKLALDATSKYFEPKATAEVNPWSSIKVEFACAYENPLLLPEIRALELGQFHLTTKGSMLSVMPVSDSQYNLLNETLTKLNS